MDTSVGEDFPKQQARVREVLKQYEEIGAPGAFGREMIRAALKRAEEAAMSGDVVETLRSYQELREIR